MTVNDIGVSRYLEYLQEPIHERIYKIEILRSEDESPRLTIESNVENGGSISNTFNNGIGVRRTSSFELINNDYQYNDLIESLTINSKFRISLGYIIDGSEVYIPHGTYFFEDPTFNSAQSSHTISIGGIDKWAGLNGSHSGTLEGTYFASAGSSFVNLIKSLLLVDIVADPIPPIIDNSLIGKTLPYDITRGAGATVSDIIAEACFALSAYAYYNAYGQLVVEPFVQDSQKGSVYNFNKEVDANYLTATKTQLNSETYNSIQITADNTQGSFVLYYEAINNRLDDKNSFANLGQKKVKKITEYTKGITTQEEIELRASWELQRYTLNDSAFNITCRPILTLDTNQVCTCSDNSVNTSDDRCVMYSINTPIGSYGQQTIMAKKAVDNFI